MVRALTLIARLHEGRTVYARRCSWCQAWASPKDAALDAQGFKTTHMICPPCAETFTEQLEVMG